LTANGEDLSAHIPEGLVVMAKDVVDMWQVPICEFTWRRRIILVQGGGSTVPSAAPDQLILHTVSAPAAT
jgi:hypothetical protein